MQTSLEGQKADKWLPCMARVGKVGQVAEGQEETLGVADLFIIFFFFLINLFIYFWLRWVFVAVHGLSLVAASGGYSSVVCRLLIAVASLVAEHGL